MHPQVFTFIFGLILGLFLCFTFFPKTIKGKKPPNFSIKRARYAHFKRNNPNGDQ